MFLYAGWRDWDTWPAVDRHRDRRADALVARLAAGVNDRNAILLSRMDWQSENALLYSARYERPDLAWTRLPDVLPHLPYFVRDNQSIGREIVLTTGAAAVPLSFDCFIASVMAPAIAFPSAKPAPRPAPVPAPPEGFCAASRIASAA